MNEAPILFVVDGVNLEIRPSMLAGAGNGLFALRDFAVGEPITEYYGELITFEEAIERKKKEGDSHIRSHIQRYWYIDGSHMKDGTPIINAANQLHGKGGAAIANHKDKKHANSRYDFYDSPVNEERFNQWMGGNKTIQQLPEERTTYITATKPIKKGDEIFVDYGREYWERRAADPLI
jgi:hypothetical protein